MQKTAQQIRTEQIRRRQQQLKQQQELKRRQQLLSQQKAPIANKPRPKPPQKPIPQPVQNIATKINVQPWLEQYNKTAYVVGGGPSLIGFDWDKLKDKFVISINRAYEVIPWSQIIYFTDDDWYAQHKAGLLAHTGVKIKGSLNPSKLGNVQHIYQFHLVGATGLEMTPGCLRHGSNSTYAVINMLTQWGFKTIYLLGVDMKWKKVGKNGNKGEYQTHFHNGHKRIDNAALYTRLNKNFNDLTPSLKQHGVEVINVNNDTALTAFPIKKYEEIFGEGCFKQV